MIEIHANSRMTMLQSKTILLNDGSKAVVLATDSETPNFSDDKSDTTTDPARVPNICPRWSIFPMIEDMPDEIFCHACHGLMSLNDEALSCMSCQIKVHDFDKCRRTLFPYRFQFQDIPESKPDNYVFYLDTLLLPSAKSSLNPEITLDVERCCVGCLTFQANTLRYFELGLARYRIPFRALARHAVNNIIACVRNYCITHQLPASEKLEVILERAEAHWPFEKVSLVGLLARLEKEEADIVTIPQIEYYINLWTDKLLCALNLMKIQAGKIAPRHIKLYKSTARSLKRIIHNDTLWMEICPNCFVMFYDAEEGVPCASQLCQFREHTLVWAKPPDINHYHPAKIYRMRTGQIYLLFFGGINNEAMYEYPASDPPIYRFSTRRPRYQSHRIKPLTEDGSQEYVANLKARYPTFTVPDVPMPFEDFENEANFFVPPLETVSESIPRTDDEGNDRLMFILTNFRRLFETYQDEDKRRMFDHDSFKAILFYMFRYLKDSYPKCNPLLWLVDLPNEVEHVPVEADIDDDVWAEILNFQAGLMGESVSSPEESVDRQMIESPVEQLIESSEEHFIESPDEQVIESPDEQVIESPEDHFIESPDEHLIKSSDKQFSESSVGSCIEYYEELAGAPNYMTTRVFTSVPDSLFAQLRTLPTSSVGELWVVPTAEPVDEMIVEFENPPESPIVVDLTEDE